MKIRLYFILLMAFVCLGGATLSFAATTKSEKVRPKLVLVKFDHWKTNFFGLPKELPILLNPNESFDPKLGRYDFMQGIEAMKIYIKLQPKSKLAKNYKKFIQKWPLYQQFFKSVDQENYTLAKAILEKVEKIDNKDPAMYFYKGSLNTHLKKYQAAEKQYRLCLKYFPDYGPAYIHLARLAKARGDEKAAKQYLEEAVKRVGIKEQEGAGVIARKMLSTL